MTNQNRSPIECPVQYQIHKILTQLAAAVQAPQLIQVPSTPTPTTTAVPATTTRQAMTSGVNMKENRRNVNQHSILSSVVKPLLAIGIINLIKLLCTKLVRWHKTLRVHLKLVIAISTAMLRSLILVPSFYYAEINFN